MELSQYSEERSKLLDFQLHQSGMFDKAILTLSASALGLSLTFVRDVVPTIEQTSLVYLHGSWLLYVASLATTLVSFQMSQHGIARAIQILDSIHAEDADSKDLTNRWTVLIVALNWTSLSSFVGGTFFLTIFVILNARGGMIGG